MSVYFDNAATTPLSKEVMEEMSRCMQNIYGNPSSIHAEGRQARAAIEDARKRIAKLIGASIGEIFFTSGGTESNNMVLKNAVRDLGVQRIISTRLEHHCVSHSIDAIKRDTNCIINYLQVDKKGHIILDELENLLTTEGGGRTLVSLMHANNEIGTMLNLEAVAAICEKYGAFFHSDTVQTVGHFPIAVNKTKIHFLSAGAHKFHGPKGVGFVYIRNEARLRPFIDGGAQERNMRGGTENLYGIVGMAKALELAYTHLEEYKSKIIEIRNYFKTKLENEFLDIQFNGDLDGNSLYTILNVSFPPSPKSELLLFNLDIAGISASGGSACSSGAEGGSHVLTSIGADPDRKSIRFSFSHQNTLQEVDYVIEKLKTMMPIAATV